MECKRYLGLKIPEDKDSKTIAEVAKETLAFMAKNHIPITPKNYEDWFFVICQAKEDKHLLTNHNLFLLYEEYLKDKPAIFNVHDAKEVSKKLKNVVNESENIISLIDHNIDKHGKFMKDSKNAIEKKDLGQIKDLYKKIEELEEENKKLKEKIDKNRDILENLEDKFKEYKKLSFKDPLTGLLNRRAFYDTIEKLKNSIPFSIIYLDIDDFKAINDTYGHTVGDKVLKSIGEVLNNFIRKETKAFRLGGEEFAILLPNLDEQESLKIAERIRKVIENHNIRLNENKIITYTASFGITKYKDGESVDDFVKRSDEAMYQAKKTGKNRVAIL